jgi:hypothetical protein
VCHGPADDPKGGWGLSVFSAKDQTEVERLTAADPIILDDVGATYEILLMKQCRLLHFPDMVRCLARLRNARLTGRHRFAMGGC